MTQHLYNRQDRRCHHDEGLQDVLRTLLKHTHRFGLEIARLRERIASVELEKKPMPNVVQPVKTEDRTSTFEVIAAVPVVLTIIRNAPAP